MIGVQDFFGVYDWTFKYIQDNYGEDALHEYWGTYIAFHSQKHAYDLIREKGIQGMLEYWGHTLDAEEAGYRFERGENSFFNDMFDCPAHRWLREHDKHEYEDYSDHCMGWVQPVLEAAGFRADHEHDHDDHCWWMIWPDTPEGKKASEEAWEENQRNFREQYPDSTQHVHSYHWGKRL